MTIKKNDMKKYNFLPLLFLLTTLLSSCEIVGGIFKAGVWVGIIAVVAVVALILFLLKKIF